MGIDYRRRPGDIMIDIVRLMPELLQSVIEPGLVKKITQEDHHEAIGKHRAM